MYALCSKDPEQYNHVLQSWESSDEGESDDDDQLKANVRTLTIVALLHILYDSLHSVSKTK